jgi:hypothetical protein
VTFFSQTFSFCEKNRLGIIFPPQLPLYVLAGRYITLKWLLFKKTINGFGMAVFTGLTTRKGFRSAANYAINFLERTEIGMIFSWYEKCIKLPTDKECEKHDDG